MPGEELTRISLLTWIGAHVDLRDHLLGQTEAVSSQNTTARAHEVSAEGKEGIFHSGSVMTKVVRSQCGKYECELLCIKHLCKSGLSLLRMFLLWLSHDFDSYNHRGKNDAKHAPCVLFIYLTNTQ